MNFSIKLYTGTMCLKCFHLLPSPTNQHRKTEYFLVEKSFAMLRSLRRPSTAESDCPVRFENEKDKELVRTKTLSRGLVIKG